MNSKRQGSNHRNSGFQPDRSCRLLSLLFGGQAGCPLDEYRQDACVTQCI